ncbi:MULTISPECIES: type IV-A pilus assembly ATPase PilB [unclassified Psychrobacter]|uniref:type IV-A pilus assembly ATPase PilB n=1 Tax=unclassified Psychrobacter TaxID=196806 RepID=UPI000C3447E5|nr:MULTISPECIES: type IV-A pilus assembly ATPase PilB [unclassified Psychrobacter]MBA6244977.1 type IV-A pilus assembly ATPase PilB [Psychrobacter sp. Urea-trap-18]MBA6286522.1 type IV-A pilus assembly ATPase PilB [Psychrobacter sp. Urea-trap-16]MBA6318533.1 type IV-A pilus assembly ATPase PilB [Psychrobacter sp. Urea-trap-20]MBA6334754.1 type IV-A pilus assembly ATPase PilB [Psychrobacter sp. Urea-trap-19]PKG61386.1 type IV-A pilus assembly ATPase PilB [Psychrobacter sp. Choline-3u-12]
MSIATSKYGGLAQQLISDGVVSEANMKTAQIESQQQQIGLVPYLVDNKLADAYQLAQMLSQAFGDPLFDLDALNIDVIPKDLVDEKIVRKFNALPLFKRGQRLFVALSDPTRVDAIDAIAFNSRLSIETIVVEENKLKKRIESAYADTMQSFDSFSDSDLNVGFDDGDEDKEDGETQLNDGVDEAPVVKFVNKMLVDAIRMGASDLHFEPYEKSFRVRFRVDGVMQKMANPPVQLANKIAARLKVMSQMDISERRVPQDGRIKLKISKNKAIDFRVNSLPTLFGEKLVLRILDPSSAMLGIDALGYEPDQQEMFLEALHKPQGMLLITGPTGSGKTVSLYTGINILNTGATNISTAEDPVEINLEGINQVNVNAKVGLTFANALKSFLRQDPDIVMVGEIRDLETAEIAIKAAQTGHMVLSTLHTNSAPETLTRLRNMGVASFNIATSVNLVIAQRLARRLCKNCKKPISIPRQSLLEIGFTDTDLDNTDNVIYEPVGCNECREGYKGRVGIYEVMKVSPDISRIIMEDGNAIDIKDAAIKNGFRDLRRSGILKVLQGVTSIQEMMRVTSE